MLPSSRRSGRTALVLLRPNASSPCIVLPANPSSTSSLAGPSRRPASRPNPLLLSPTARGKQPALDLYHGVATDLYLIWATNAARWPRLTSRVGPPSHAGQLNMSRTQAFHTSARRDALPLLPAAVGILKSTTALATATALSRVLISFFPIGTLATMRMLQFNRWINEDVREPDVSPDAEEFFLMWCRGEKGKHLSRAEARALLLEGTVLPDEAVTRVGPDGRKAYTIPGMRNSRLFAAHSGWEEFETKAKSGNPHDIRKAVNFAHHVRFYLPDLPPASEGMYQALTEEERRQVLELRRYHAGIGLFESGMRKTRWLVTALLLAPFLLVFGVYAAGLERVPLTGRWRTILLTPKEEDTIAASLAGVNWYRSVINLLTTPDRPAPPILPYDDWRWRWVQGVLRQLEVAALEECRGALDPQNQSSSVPPAEYPLLPRPRASSLLHSALPGGEPGSGKEHLEIGLPYSLMILESDERNAFSYGFGGKGASGIVVYTGLLDGILREHAIDEAPQPAVVEPRGWFSSLFSTGPPRPAHPTPTDSQTLHLACVLSHEMGHLLLSHHLETLSQEQVLWPSVLGLSMDLLRAFIWPITFFLGPTVNDALANFGRTSADELSVRYGQIGFQWKHEYEADLAGLRLITMAGYDPKLALEHFTDSVPHLSERLAEDEDTSLTGKLFKLWAASTHPSAEKRTAAIKDELVRWAKEANKQHP